jgi:hypothetical protein
MEAGTQFIGVKPGINMQERKSNVANNPTDVFTIEEIANVSRPYKVYTALLTQSGGDAPQSISTGTLTVGVSYYFADFNEPEEPWDFSNVGGPIYPNTDSFVANKTSEPNSYGSANIGYNTGAPVVTVLENTIGNIWFTYIQPASYQANSDGLFIINKTFGQGTSKNNEDGIGFYVFTVLPDTVNNVNIYSTEPIAESSSDDLLDNTPIEIRVYN